MNIKEAKLYVKNELTQERYNHTLRVADVAVDLAVKNRVNVKHAELAAIFHDVAKCWDKEKLKHWFMQSTLPNDLLNYHHELWHGPVGALFVKEKFDITNTDILNAIYYHTTGRAGMSKLELIIFVADYIEPGRDIPGVEDVRKKAWESLQEAGWMILSRTIKHLITKKATIHPETFFAYNDFARRLNRF